MQLTTMLAFSLSLLMACGPRGGGAESAATDGARDANQADAQSGAGARPGVERVPFGPRGEARRTQDSVLRISGPRQRQKVRPDST